MSRPFNYEDTAMNIRESLEQWEKEYLSPYAMLSMNSQGRLKE